jgi:DNA-binding CsgD family transcriptional regulator
VIVNTRHDVDPSAFHVAARSYGLTPSETRLALALLEGQSLRAAAAATAISYQTARSQLKQIFAKTGTRRQAELVRALLAASVA